jgi:hypothetical protein
VTQSDTPFGPTGGNSPERFYAAAEYLEADAELNAGALDRALTLCS